MKKLILPTLQTFLIGMVLLGLVTFLPAWTFNYWQAWVFIVVFLVSVSGVGLYLSINDPELLERRKKFGPGQEQRLSQKIIMSLSLVGIVGMLVFCGLDHRFGWSRVPALVSLVGDALVALGLYINVLVFKENTYGASNIQVEEGQKVISTGPYALIRHPMYMGVLVMIIGVPLALGSFWGLLVLAVISSGLIWRILDEEKALRQDLPGYVEYTQKVRYRLVPYLW
jgi:protein-S-isoprenylcysteine O-methyltransferase Ste14